MTGVIAHTMSAACSPSVRAVCLLQAYHLAMREIKLLRATTHEHVVSVIEAFRSQSSGNVYLVRNGCQAVDTWVGRGAKGPTTGARVEDGAQGPQKGTRVC